MWHGVWFEGFIVKRKTKEEMALGYILFKPLFINFKNHKACIAKEWGKKKGKEKENQPRKQSATLMTIILQMNCTFKILEFNLKLVLQTHQVEQCPNYCSMFYGIVLCFNVLCFIINKLTIKIFTFYRLRVQSTLLLVKYSVPKGQCFGIQTVTFKIA